MGAVGGERGGTEASWGVARSGHGSSEIPLRDLSLLQLSISQTVVCTSVSPTRPQALPSPLQAQE